MSLAKKVVVEDETSKNCTGLKIENDSFFGNNSSSGNLLATVCLYIFPSAIKWGREGEGGALQDSMTVFIAPLCLIVKQFQYRNEKMPMSQQELLFHEILYLREPLVGSLSFFFILVLKGEPVKKVTL